MSGARLTYYGVMVGLYTCIAAFFGWFTYDRARHRQNWLLFATCMCFVILGAWTNKRLDERRERKGRNG